MGRGQGSENSAGVRESVGQGCGEGGREKALPRKRPQMVPRKPGWALQAVGPGGGIPSSLLWWLVAVEALIGLC